MKVTKKILAIAMAATMVFSTSALTMTASAAKWVKSDNGIMYQQNDGTYAKNKWLKTKSGDKYYIKADGTRATGWTEIDGDMYYFNKKTGKATINKKIVIGSYSYKFDKNGKWTGIVYSKDGKKNVTKSVNVEKLTGQSNTTSSNKTTSNKETGLGVVRYNEGTIPETITIKGKTYKTSATNTFVNKKADAIYPKGTTKNTGHTRWEVDIAGCTDKDLEVLKYCTNLKELTLTSKDFENECKMTNLDFCYYMPNLEKIEITAAVNLTNIDGLSACKNLKRVEISHSPITNLDALNGLTKIEEVYVNYTHIDNVDGLANCKNLKKASFKNGRLTNIDGLKNKDKLTSLSLNQNRRLKDISVLSTCDSLKSVYMDSCTSMANWKDLLNIPKLNYVSIGYNVLGSKGPYDSVKAQLENKGVKVNTYDGKGVHDHYVINSHKESADNAAWDAKYRPATVYGDELKCEAGCEYCVADGYTSVNGLA